MRRLSIFDGKGKNRGRTEFRWVDFSPRMQGFFLARPHLRQTGPARRFVCRRVRPFPPPAASSGRICGKPALHAAPCADASVFPRPRRHPPAAFAANRPCTLFRVPTRPSFPAPGRVLRPQLRQTSPARCSVCRRVRGIDSFADKQCHVCTWSEVGGRFAANAAMGRRSMVGVVAVG